MLRCSASRPTPSPAGNGANVSPRRTWQPRSSTSVGAAHPREFKSFPSRKKSGGLTIDHVCHNADHSCVGGPTCAHRACVRFAHLKCVPLVKNVMRGARYGPRNARKTHCCKGHSFDLLNTYIAAKGSRECRTCHRLRERLRKRSIRIVQLRTSHERPDA